MALIDHQRRYIRSGPIRIAVDEYPGVSPAIIFVHPNRTSPRVWDHVIAASDRPERMLTPALRGHGASDWPETGYRLEDHCDDLIAVIESSGAEPVVLCGQATGATLALMAAARMPPGRILAVIAAQPAVAIPAAINDLVQTQVAAQQRLKSRDAARAVLPFIRFWSDTVIEHHLDHLLMPTSDGECTWRYHPGGVSATEAQLLRPLTGLLHWTGPTLVIGGSNSTVLPAASIEAVARSLPQAELQWLERADHRLSQDNPAGLATLIDRFLAQILG